MLYHRRHRRHRRHHPQQQHVNVCFLLDSPHQLHAINVAPAFKNNVRGGSWHEPTKKGKKNVRPANTTSTCHNYFAAKEQAGWEIQFVWAIVRRALTHALAHVLISTCNFTNCNMPAMKVQKQTQKVVSACLLKFVLVHVCVCVWGTRVI